MATPVTSVARFIIQESDRISNLKLQKLLYYVQGWHLGMKARPLFDENIEAWVHGPVVPVIFQLYRGHGWHDITKPAGRVSLSASEEDHVRRVIQAYAKYTGDSLKWMTHNESPWIEARRGLHDSDLCNNVITKESMRAFFESKRRQA